MSSDLTGGQLTWADAITGPLAGATCLWQDLDGLHAEPAPQAAPPTSILWGWRDDTLIRVRLDGETAYVAVLTAPDVGVATVPWDLRREGDGRVAGLRGPATKTSTAYGKFEQVIVDGTSEGRGPITFIRPARHA
jgi:hypothetical protein